ncbi:pectate lyase family protein [Algibacillus agarilyticus]|uniref:pectate lyase family protein n=1 Tax=Algibacillus agarilyticus TaxID=2234133 RepID=UPI000DD0BDE6|nr:hypothetical protein [Algibacillus agarilyticus]
MKKLNTYIATLAIAGLLLACGGGSKAEKTNTTPPVTIPDTTVPDTSTPDTTLPDLPPNNALTTIPTQSPSVSGFASRQAGTTGGAGGQIIKATTGKEIHQALCNRASSDTPVIIQVEGTINHANTEQVSGDSCNTAADVIELKEVSNITLIGVGNGALFDEIGIHLRAASNIIIQNIHVRNVKKSGSPTSNGGDAIGMESNVSNVWVDHVTLEAQGGESEGYDALFDMKANTKYVTLSYSILRNSGRGGLVGSTDGDSNNGPVTFHHNYYQNINSRTPLLRHATAHAYNNYYNGIASSGMNPRIGGAIKAQNNVFENAQDPLGTFYTNDKGFWDVSGNLWTNTVTWTSQGDKNYPAGPNPTSTININIPYDHALDDANCVKDIVLATAGANTHLAVSAQKCTRQITGSGQDDTHANNGDSNTDTSTDTSNNSKINLALTAGADGSSKASGSSYGNVRDGNFTTFWSPNGSTGRISIKGVNQAFNHVNIIETVEASGAITKWSLVDDDTDQVLASGTDLTEAINVAEITSSKLNFLIESSIGTVQIAEFEIFNTGGATNSGGSNNSSTDTETTTGSGSGSGSDNTQTDWTNDASNQATTINYPDDHCAALIHDNNINWHGSAIQTEQAIVECLALSLGQPVGYGEKATGGYNPEGNSNLVVITNDKPEDQILAAIASNDHNWIVFDKQDFSSQTDLMMYRPYCADTALQTALGVDEATCRDPYAYCNAKNISRDSCLITFFNNVLNDRNLPIQNYLINSNTTLDGRGANTRFVFNGFKIGADSSGASTHQSENVIITNHYFVGVGHTEDHELDPDMIRSTGESHDIWIHQNTFDTTGDSAFDVKVGAHDISISFNKLINVKRAALHGSSDSRAINSQITTSIYNNLFVTTDDNFGTSAYNTMRRVPLLRRGQTHMFNNVFYGYRKDVMSLRVGAKALIENNLFMNSLANTKGDDLADWQKSLFDDAVKEGGLEISGSYVYEANTHCELNGTFASLDVTQGIVPNMFADYSSTSQDTISAYRQLVGQSLRNYVVATAGKGAKAPWLSSYTQGYNNVIGANSNTTTCQ